jgi:tetratricopeptide (TPR) repeat protein
LINLEAASKLADSGNVEDAHKIVVASMRQNPEDPQAAFIEACCHLRANRPETAYFIYRYVQKFKEYDGVQLWNSIAHCLAEMGRMDDAERWYAKALAKEPNATTYASYASIFTIKGNPRRAVEMAEKAIELDETNEEAKWNGSLALLKLKEWRKGWEWYDTVIGTRVRPNPPRITGLDLKPWEGKGGNVLVYGEQGLGDELMFSSILPDVVKNADKVVCIVDGRLIGLLSRSFPDVMFADRKGKELVLPEEVHLTHTVSIASLGRYFRNKDLDFPGTAYLVPDPDRVTMYRALVDSLGEGKKIGIMWKGGRGGLDEFERLIDLTDFECLADKGHLISLNHLPEAKEELNRFYDVTGVKIHHWPWTVEGDYDNTAALVSTLDCVVSITGSVAHCAAGLGVETHVLVPRMPQWRYGHEGNSIPWYKSMTLYRQTDKWPVGETI